MPLGDPVVLKLNNNSLACTAAALLDLLQVELAAIKDPVQKLRRLGAISKIFAAEILGTVALAPFAVKASSLYRSLPSIDSYDPADTQPVYIAKDVRHSEATTRNTVDLYLPAEAAAATQEKQQVLHSKVPVVVFVHGGKRVHAPAPAFQFWRMQCSQQPQLYQHSAAMRHLQGVRCHRHAAPTYSVRPQGALHAFVLRLQVSGPLATNGTMLHWPTAWLGWV